MSRSQPVPLLDPVVARAAIDRAVERYLRKRRALIPEFTRRHFGLRGSLRIHRKAFGGDLWRAPANVFLAVPAVGAATAAIGLRKMGLARASGWLERRHILLETDVAREVSWLIQTELLKLPCRQEGRESRHDALADEILSDPDIDAALWPWLVALGKRADDPAFRDQLTALLTTYTGTRSAAAEIAASLLTLGAGAAAQKFTPGAISLGSVLAAGLAQQMAIAGFPLGTTLGALWYGWFPAAAGPALATAVTASVMAGVTVVAAFAGIVTDPVQRLLGVHQRRLNRLIDALEKALRGEQTRLAVADHYVARILDMLDLLRTAARL